MRHRVIFAVAAAGGVWFGCASQGRSSPGSPGEPAAAADASEELDCYATACLGWASGTVQADGTCPSGGCPGDTARTCGGVDYVCCGECLPPTLDGGPCDPCPP
jgi:hypothetical protein